jgi:hypothetical protein
MEFLSSLIMFSRRDFIKKILISIAAIPIVNFILSSCGRKISEHNVSGRIVGASASRGHLLREKMLSIPSSFEEIDFVIVGGGISGLSAARHLHNNGVSSFTLLELENETGGNSISGKNEITSYPWGAHYLPLPNLDNKELLSFLEDSKVIIDYDVNGIPNYNEYYLCHDPQDRLYIHGQWQDGLIPHFGVPSKDLQEINKFLKEIEALKSRKGKDGKYAFDIPLDKSSNDEEFVKLDDVTMYEYLIANKYTSTYLYWFVNYGCRDDYGTDFKNTSAWAGLHYFASRKGKAGNAESSAVLTWPEGNNFLARKLKTSYEHKIRTNSLVYSIEPTADGVHIDYFNPALNESRRIKAKKCIVCTPQFVNKRIIKKRFVKDERDYEQFSYSPWMIANLTMKPLEERNGRPLSWDNVFYEGKSLGFINSNHQHLSQKKGNKVFTYYYPLTGLPPLEERIAAQKRTHQEWMNIIFQDVKKAYPEFETSVINADIWLWGHGMIRPIPGFIHGHVKKEFCKSFDNQIFYGHTDLSGISIFEEAFHQGLRAAKEALL